MKSNHEMIPRVALAAAAALLLTGTALCAEFTDAAEIAHPEAVGELAERGIISGMPDGSFQPKGATLRSEMAKMLSVLIDPQPEGVPSSGFTDVSGTWAERYIDHCCSLGLITGRGNGIFDPNGVVTGAETAKMLLGILDYEAAGFTGAGWTQRVNEAAEAAGLYEGFTADPAAPLTRENAALLICNMLHAKGEQVMDTGGAPTGVVVMPDGALLITDTFYRAVFRQAGRELNAYAGAITEAADVNGQPLGGYYDASMETSTFKLPWAIAPFLDGYAVSDAENNVLRLIQSGQVRTLNPSGDTKGLAYPTGLAAGGDGSLYVSDTHNGLIRRISSDGKMTTAAQGLKDPMGLCWQDGVLYIAETGANRIVQLKDGKISTVAGSGEEGYADGAALTAQFSGPKGVAVDEEGVLYVSDTGNSAVRRIADGQVTAVMLHDPADEESSYPISPVGLTLQGQRLYICDEFTGMLLIVAVK